MDSNDRIVHVTNKYAPHAIQDIFADVHGLALPGQEMRIKDAVTFVRSDNNDDIIREAYDEKTSGQRLDNEDLAPEYEPEYDP